MRIARKTLLPLAAAAMVLAPQFAGAPAQAAEMKHSMAASSDAPASAGYQAAMNKMDREMMAMKYSGNADVDFVRGMIPHHQAAVEMAEVLLAYGKDPELRKLAKNVITAQRKEIVEMEDWLAAHPMK